MKKIIDTPNAPSASGRAFSQGVVAQGMLYTAGQVAIDPTGGFIGGTVAAQTHQVLKNLQAICEASGTSLDNAVKCTCYLADMKDYGAFNEVYSQYFDEATAPAREYVGVSSLPLGAGVEISLVAVVT